LCLLPSFLGNVKCVQQTTLLQIPVINYARVQYFGMSRRIYWYIDTNVEDGPTTSIIRVEEFRSNRLYDAIFLKTVIPTCTSVRKSDLIRIMAFLVVFIDVKSTNLKN
jgi:hypothetical protein